MTLRTLPTSPLLPTSLAQPTPRRARARLAPRAHIVGLVALALTAACGDDTDPTGSSDTDATTDASGGTATSSTTGTSTASTTATNTSSTTGTDTSSTTGTSTASATDTDTSSTTGTDTSSTTDTDTSSTTDTDTSSTTDTDGPPTLDVEGSYDDNFGGYSEWTATQVRFGRDERQTYAVATIDNLTGTVIAQNGAAAFAPGAWSRFDLATVGGTLYYCQTAFDAADQASAEATPPADPTDPAVSGCGGFSWTALTPAAQQLRDTWTSVTAIEVEHQVSTRAWTRAGERATIVSFDNLANAIVVANGDGSFGRYDYAWDAGELYLCEVVADAASAAAAAMAPASDITDVAGGCKGAAFIALAFAPIAARGSWDDNLGMPRRHDIDTRRWQVGDDRFTYDTWSNRDGFAVARNASSNATAPGLWSRWAFTEQAGALYVCPTIGDAADAAAAEAAATEDRGDLASGCGGAPWLRLSPAPIELLGTYDTPGGDVHTVGAADWAIASAGEFAIATFDNLANEAVLENDLLNPANPGLFSLVQWTTSFDGRLWFCLVANDLADPAAAAAVPRAPTFAPDAFGCGAGAWTELVAR